MYITVTTVLLFLILIAILDNNKKEGEQTFFEELGFAFYMLLGFLVILAYGLIVIGIPLIIVYLMFFDPEIFIEIINMIKGLHPIYILSLIFICVFIAFNGEESEVEKEDRSKVTTVLITSVFVTIIFGVCIYNSLVFNLIPVSILNIFSIIWNVICGAITITLMFVAPSIILYKWQPIKFWSIHCFCYSLLLLLFASFVGSIIAIVYQKII